MGKNTFEQVRNCSWGRHGEEWAKNYQEIMYLIRSKKFCKAF